MPGLVGFDCILPLLDYLLESHDVEHVVFLRHLPGQVTSLDGCLEEGWVFSFISNWSSTVSGSVKLGLGIDQLRIKIWVRDWSLRRLPILQYRLRWYSICVGKRRHYAVSGLNDWVMPGSLPGDSKTFATIGPEVWLVKRGEQRLWLGLDLRFFLATDMGTECMHGWKGALSPVELQSSLQRWPILKGRVLAVMLRRHGWSRVSKCSVVSDWLHLTQSLQNESIKVFKLKLVILKDAYSDILPRRSLAAVERVEYDLGNCTLVLLAVLLD